MSAAKYQRGKTELNTMAFTRHQARRLRALQQEKMATSVMSRKIIVQQDKVAASDGIWKKKCRIRLVRKGKGQATKGEKPSAFQKTIMNICSQLREHQQIHRLVKMHCHLNVSNSSTTMYFTAELR